MPERVGVLGGTFNPVHLGHLRAAEEALEILDLDKFMFAPAVLPPHKPGRHVVSFDHRWRMLSLAVAGHPRFRISDHEREIEGKSYTVRSLQKLQEHLAPGSMIHFLLGLDAFLELDTWWRYRELFRLAAMVVLRRPGYREEQLSTFLHRNVTPGYGWEPEAGCFQAPGLMPVYYLRITRLHISSSKIRQLLRQGRSVRYLVPPEVASYIESQALYQETG